jgi:hypothetical protein
MNKTDILRQLDLGAIIAEQDALLSRCFVAHPVLDDVLLDRADLVLGAKGAGKSAIWKEITQSKDQYKSIKDVEVTLVTNPAGDVEFRDVLQAISADEFPSADDLRSAWRLYLLAQFWRAAKPHLMDQGWAEDFEKELRRYGILPEARSTAKKAFAFAIAKVQSLKDLNINWTEGLAFSFADDTLKAGGSVAAIPFNDLLKSINEALSAEGVRAWLVLDRLDEIVLGDEERENVVLKGLLLAYRDISDYPHLRAKIFLRDDVYSRVTSTGHVPALTHVRARASRPIDWSVDDLLELVVRRLLTNESLVELLGVADEQITNSDERRNVFYALFPRKIDKGRAAEGFKWICDRIADGNGVSTPRDLLSVIEAARTEQIRQNQREDVRLEGTQLFSEDSIRAAVKAVATDNLETRFYAEYPDLRPVIRKFERGKADHNEETLRDLLGADWGNIVQRLERVGFIYRRTRNNTEMWTIPFFFSYALDIRRGAGFEFDDSGEAAEQ